MNFTQILREDMGAYVCMAANGIAAPDVRKIFVEVTCKYINMIVHPHHAASSSNLDSIRNRKSKLSRTLTNEQSPKKDAISGKRKFTKTSNEFKQTSNRVELQRRSLHLQHEHIQTFAVFSPLFIASTKLITLKD